MEAQKNYTFTPHALPASQARSEAARSQALDESLAKLVQIARKAPYYARRLAGISATSIADLKRLPILTPADYVEHMFPYSNELLTTEGFLGGTVSRTGGTTDHPKYAVWGTADKDRQIEASLPLLETLGVSQGDVVANLLHVGNLYSGLLSVEYELFRMGITSLPLSIVSPEVLLKTWEAFRFNVLVIQPSSALPVLRQALDLNPEFRVEKIIFGGQAMAKADQAWLRERLGVKRIASVIASNDGGPFGYQCDHMQDKLHHLLDEYNFIEIVDEEGNPVPDGETGRVLTTNLHKHAVPLLRYEIGDLGRIVPGKCACGRSDRRFEFLGRSKDGFILIGNTTNVSELRAALAPCALSELQLVLDSVKGEDQLLIRFSAENRVDPDQMRDLLAKRYGDIDQVALRFEQLPLGSLPKNPVSGKIIGLVDLRKGT